MKKLPTTDIKKWHVHVSGWCTQIQEWKSWTQRSKWHFASGWCTPPPRNERPPKSWIQVKCDIIGSSWCHPLPRNEIVAIQSQSDNFGSGWCDPPPWEIEIGINMNAIAKKIISREVIKYILPIYPPFHYHYLILCLNRKLVNFNFKWVYGLKPHPPALSSQKNKMLIFGLCSTSGDWLGWSMDSNPIHHPTPAKKIKCSFLDYIQLLVISWANWVNGLKPHPPKKAHSSQKNKMLIFGLRSTSDDQPGWSMDSNPIHHPSPTKKIKCLFLDYVQLLMIGRAGRWTWTPNPSPAKNIKCLFLDYIQHLMTSQTGQWTQTPSATPLQPKKIKCFIFGWRSTSDNRLSKPSKKCWPKHKKNKKGPLRHQKIKCSFLDYVQILMIGQAIRAKNVDQNTKKQKRLS